MYFLIFFFTGCLALSIFSVLSQKKKEGKQRDLESENEANEGVEGKDQELKVKVEEILTLVKEMNRGQKEKDEVKARKGEAREAEARRQEWKKMKKIER